MRGGTSSWMSRGGWENADFLGIPSLQRGLAEQAAG